MSDLHDLSALEQAEAVRKRRVSSVELTEHYLRRIEQADVIVGAFITVTPDAALAAAAAADDAVARCDDSDVLPPLLGVPTGIKDICNTAGVRTTFGSAAFADFVPAYDDHVVTRTRSAGLVSLGKTNTPEFGLPCYTEPDIAPPARTPYDLTRSAGGSSGGAAAAVAAGLLPVAPGNDGAGSVRIPASVCGLVGLKPSRGRVSNGPLGDTTGMVVSGPLARTVADAAALLDALAGPMPGDLAWAPAPAESFLASTRREPGRLVIGRYQTPVIADTEVHPDCLAGYERTCHLLAELGHEIVDVPPPFGDERSIQAARFFVVWSVRSALAPVRPDRIEQLRPLTRWLRRSGAGRTGPEYAGACAQLDNAARAVILSTAHCDAVLTPSLAAPPALVGELRNDDDPEADFAAQSAFTPFTAPYNLTGQPAISLPLHVGETGLPIGVQLVGRPYGEATLLALAAQLEAARPWAQRRPELW